MSLARVRKPTLIVLSLLLAVLSLGQLEFPPLIDSEMSMLRNEGAKA
jgi:hypothetical protein